MKNLLVATLIIIVVSVAHAQESSQDAAVSADVADSVNADVTVKVKSARGELKRAFAEFAEKAGIAYGEMTPDGRLYCKGQAPVNADYASPQFIKSRSMAYERAYLDAIAHFMMDSYGFETTAKVSEFYDNQSEDARSSPVAKAKSLSEKVSLLADAALNSALTAMKVPSEKFSTAGVIEKRKLLHDSIAVEVMNKVLHASSGCVPVKTFEARGDNGRYYIGVIVRYDNTSKTLAKCFKQKVRPAISRKTGLAVKDALPCEDEMTSNFGVRIYYDETGTPALLSFGQWGCAYTGKSAAQSERAEDHAVNQARMLADSGLTSFINSFVDASESADVNETISESVTFTDDGNATPDEFSRIADIYRKSIKMTGSDSLKGRSTVYDEVLTHPNGHKVAVVVRRWSFGTLDAIDSFDKASQAPKAEKSKVSASKEGAGVREGRTFDF